MKTVLYILVVAAAILVLNLLINKCFFNTELDRAPELTELKESEFEFSSAKPFYFKVNNALYYSPDGKLDYSSAAIRRGAVEEAWISPDSRYALICDKNTFTLIDHTGKEIAGMRRCTGANPLRDSKSGCYNSSGVQWSKDSDFFLLSRDWVESKNHGANRTSIYKYFVADKSLKPLIDLEDELEGDLMLSSDGRFLYYEFATPEGELAFRKAELSTGRICSEHFQNDSLKLTNLNPDSVFFNYSKIRENFQGNSFDLQSIITTAEIEDLGLYYKSRDTTVKLLGGISGYSGFKGNSLTYFQGGFYLPGNRYFIANIAASNFSGQLVIDTKTFQVMKLRKETAFYFNVNSGDCRNFVFRYEIMPDVEFATSVRLQLEGKTGKE